MRCAIATIQFLPVQPMWKLKMRGERCTPFAEIGKYGSLTEAAEAIQKIENDQKGVFASITKLQPATTLLPEAPIRCRAQKR